MKRFAGVMVGALALVALSAAPASADLLDRYLLDIDESRSQVKVDGPGFKVKLTKDALTTQIDDARFGFPQSGRPIERPSQIGPGPGARPYMCENGTYRATAAGRGVFAGVERVSSDTPRPVPPYTDAFNTGFGNPFTFVGTLTATVINERGETFTLMMSDLANEVVVLGRFFVSSNPIHAFFVDSQGKIRDRASLVGALSWTRRPANLRIGSWTVAPAISERRCPSAATTRWCSGRSSSCRSTRRMRLRAGHVITTASDRLVGGHD